MPTGIKPPCRFLYRPTWASMLASAAFAGGCMAAMVYLARHTPADRPMDGIPLSAGHALTLFWAAAALAGLLTLFAILVILSRLIRVSFLTVGAESITVPTGLLFVREVEVPYTDIKFLREVDVDGFATITLVFARGKCSIACAKMPSTGDYEALKNFLAQRSFRRGR